MKILAVCKECAVFFLMLILASFISFKMKGTGEHRLRAQLSYLQGRLTLPGITQVKSVDFRVTEVRCMNVDP